MFAYLTLGKLTPGATVKASSRSLPRLRRRPATIYVGAYCDGQLTSPAAAVNAGKINSRTWTGSMVTELQRMKSKFRPSRP